MTSQKLRPQSLSLLAVAVVLTACEKPTPITSVEFQKDSSLSGSIHVTTPDERLGPGQVLVLQSGDRNRNFDIPETFSTRVNLALNYQGTAENLPAGSQRIATLQGTLKLKGSPKGGGRIETKLEDGLVYLPGIDQPEPVTCDELFQIQGADRKLQIRFMGFQSLLSCKSVKSGLSLAHLNPDAIGNTALRDVSAGENRYTEAQDQQMGKEYAEQFVAENRSTILDANHPASRWAQNMMEQIADASDRPDIRPTVYVINANVMNAFALPGGYIFVFRGLIDAANTEAEILGVLGHEWAHVTARHGTKNVSRSLKVMRRALTVALIGVAANIAGNISDREWLAVLGEFVTNASLIGGQVYLLNKSREAETEADRLGSQYAWAMKYEPWGLADMFSVMMARTPGANSMDDAYSSHPAMPKRIANVLNWGAFYYPAQRGYIRTTATFEHARRELTIVPMATTAQSNGIGNAFASHVQGKVNSILENQANQDRAVITTAVLASKALGGLLGGKKDKEEKKDESGSEEL